MSPCGNIVLIGLSGAGKTSCAQILAGLLDLAVLDTDDIIQKKAEMSVARIFTEKGEAHFRSLERQLIEELLETKLGATVLSVGGGLPAQTDNIQLLKKIGLTVYLRASPVALALRLTEDLSRDHSLRPLLARTNESLNASGDCKEESSKSLKNKYLEAALVDQLARRHEFYEQAHLVIDTEGKSKQEICREIQTIIVNNGS
jgi:shikimate kinase